MYAFDILKKFKMDVYKSILTPMEEGLTKNGTREFSKANSLLANDGESEILTFTSLDIVDSIESE